MNDEIENKVSEIVNRYFPGYKFSLMGDPEDEKVQLIRLYDVADDDVKKFKDELWDVIEEHLEVEDVSFIPSIVSHTDTVEFYSDHLRVPDNVCVRDDDFTLKEDVCRKIEELIRKQNKSFSVEDSFCEYSYPVYHSRSSRVTTADHIEDGGCGYAGEKCRLAA